ncbi:MAG: FAD-binding oxidoreductase [Candidatus Limnocylindrales bacterium]
MDRPTIPAFGRRVPQRPAVRPGGPGAAGHGAAATPNATIVERLDISPTVVRLRVRPDAGVPAFEPGQYLALGVPVDERPLLRPYSTASPLGEDEALEFLVRLVPDGALTPRLWTLGPGGRVRLGPPKGLFIDDHGDPRRRLFIATGTGIAPLVSMLETRLYGTPDGAIRRRPIILHGASNEADLAYRDRLSSLAFAGRIRYVPVVSRPADPANAAWRGTTGRLDALLPAVLASAAADPGDLVAFVCGSPGLVCGATASLAALGVPDDAVRTEAYWTAPAAA